MADIRDLISAATPEPATVPIGGMEVALRPVTMVEILRVLKRFPALKSVLFGDQTALVDVLLDVGPDAVAALLACATGHPGDQAVEAGIQKLPDDQLIALLAAAIKLTMPDGIESFFARLAALASAAGLVPTDSQNESSVAA